MNINRHNYEAFFLLYVDKELSATDRKAVDMFVQENPDLQIELALLQDTVVKADDIVLDKKDWLYMEEGVSALQENLFLYADGELTAADKKTVEALLATNKKARAEWAVLKQTKLQPDMAVVFADKGSLYRKEAGRVVVFRWWRVAAAAILVGIGLWTGIAVYKNNTKTTTGTGELANDGKTNPQIKNVAPANATSEIKQPGENSATENITSTAVQKNNEGNKIENIEPGIEKKNDQNIVNPKENTVVQNNNKAPGNNLPPSERVIRAGKPALQNINRIESNETNNATVLSENNNSKRVSGNNEAVVKTNPKENRVNENNNSTDPNITILQVANNKSSEEEDNNRYLNVDGDKDKRTALGGFLRKAKRVLERTTNVKAGDGVKIAGFEIALK